MVAGGEILFLKDVFPHTPLIGYFEYFYTMLGGDIGFAPDDPVTPDTAPRLRTKNTVNLLSLEAADVGQTPTHWQQSLYPVRYHPMLQVVHEGIDTQLVRPDPQARYKIPHTEIELCAGEEVLTYIGRNLEPHRGFPSLMRSLPDILARRPLAQVVLVGADGVSYGPPPARGGSWKDLMVKELGDTVDWSRIHFVGRVPYLDLLSIMRVSRVHVYLTYPFVLSWSMLEAMASGCVIVGSATPPVQEVIEDGKNGLLVDFFSPQQIAERVVSVLAQDKWAQQNVPGYDRNKAPAVLLESASGSSHAKISAAQRSLRYEMKSDGANPWGNNIRQEFDISYRQMVQSGVPQDVVRKAMKDSYKYFDSLGAFK